jgi:general secretion pathway protein M
MTLSPRTSKLLAVALLIAVSVLGYVLVVEPLTNLYAARQARISVLAMRAAQLGVRDEDAPQVKRRLADLQAHKNEATPFWPGATDAVAAAGLQERVTTLLGNEGAVIGSTEVLPPAADGDLHKIALKVSFQGEIDQLEHVLHAVETMSPSLMVEHLSVRAADTPQGDRPLAVELQLFGFAKPQTNRPAS